MAYTQACAPSLILQFCTDCIVADVVFSHPNQGECPSGMRVSVSDRADLRRITLTSRVGLTISASDDVILDESSLGSSFVNVEDSSGLIMSNNTTTGAFAMRLTNSPSAQIRNNTFVNSGCPTLVDVQIGSTGTVIDSNAISGLHLGCGAPLPSAFVVDSSQNVRVTHNLISSFFGEPITLRSNANSNVMPPSITLASNATITGSSGAPDGSVIEIFGDPEGHPGNWLGDAIVVGGLFELQGVSLDPAYLITATVTDPLGNTSPFSPAVPVQ